MREEVVKFNHIANESIQNAPASKILRELAEIGIEVDEVIEFMRN